MQSSNLFLFLSSSGKDKNKNVLQVRKAEGRASLKESLSQQPLPHTPILFPLSLLLEQICPMLC